jgi:hypothetical protein
MGARSPHSLVTTIAVSVASSHRSNAIFSHEQDTANVRHRPDRSPLFAGALRRTVRASSFGTGSARVVQLPTDSAGGGRLDDLAQLDHTAMTSSRARSAHGHMRLADSVSRTLASNAHPGCRAR